jgi:hypothetical protein
MEQIFAKREQIFKKETNIRWDVTYIHGRTNIYCDGQSEVENFLTEVKQILSKGNKNLVKKNKYLLKWTKKKDNKNSLKRTNVHEEQTNM